MFVLRLSKTTKRAQKIVSSFHFFLLFSLVLFRRYGKTSKNPNQTITILLRKKITPTNKCIAAVSNYRHKHNNKNQIPIACNPNQISPTTNPFERATTKNRAQSFCSFVMILCRHCFFDRPKFDWVCPAYFFTSLSDAQLGYACSGAEFRLSSLNPFASLCFNRLRRKKNLLLLLLMQYSEFSLCYWNLDRLEWTIKKANDWKKTHTHWRSERESAALILACWMCSLSPWLVQLNGTFLPPFFSRRFFLPFLLSLSRDEFY